MLPIALGSLHDSFGGYGAGPDARRAASSPSPFIGVGRPARRLAPRLGRHRRGARVVTSRPGARTAASAAGSSRRFATGACMPCAAMRSIRSTAAARAASRWRCRRRRASATARSTPLLRGAQDERFREATLGRGARRGRRAPARDPRRARPGLDRVLHLRPAADRGLLRGQQARQGLPAAPTTSTPTRACACRAPSPRYDATFGADGPPPAYADIELDRLHPAAGLQHRRPATRSCGGASARRRSAARR